jgi:hypothetical protein
MFLDSLLPRLAFLCPPFSRFPRYKSFGWLLIRKSSAYHWEGVLRWDILGKVAGDEDKDGFRRSWWFRWKVRISQVNYLRIYHTNKFMSLFKFCQSKYCTK